ncbi:MAG TPA: GNAT family N-acetyltransferase [Solirubrobacteraceae bacterium]|jgi:GNAT superfamily N-acetyltransferase
MGSATLDVYLAAFLARCVAMSRSAQPLLDEAGIHGLLPCGRDRQIRLLVTDDRARDQLPTLIGDARGGMVTVCSPAVQCTALLAGNSAWLSETATAMICRDLQQVSAGGLPCGLTLRPVRRLADDAPRGVPLEQAVEAASRADPRITDPQALADHLQSLPRAFSLWAAVDDGGVVRATSGSAAFQTTASVIFVNTDPDWRRRGIARAMTATALDGARQAGARSAGIDASEAGRELYLRLGFEDAAVITRFRLSRSVSAFPSDRAGELDIAQPVLGEADAER